MPKRKQAITYVKSGEFCCQRCKGVPHEWKGKESMPIDTPDEDLILPKRCPDCGSKLWAKKPIKKVKDD